VPRLDEYRLREEYGDIIYGFHQVDSKTGTGIKPLREAIASQAAELPQVGELFPRKWREAQREVLKSKRATLKRDTFKRKCKRCGLDSAATNALAGLLDNLGHIVYFGESLGLDDLVILKPEWLSTAIGLVLEDPVTVRDNGVLLHKRLATIWNNPNRPPRERYEATLHPHFIRLMERFDVSYRIDESSSLVGELVPTVRPELPWSRQSILDEALRITDQGKDENETTSQDAHTRLVVRLEEDPPGLVPWLIVRNHRYNERRLHWTGGVFLESARHGQALLELIDRELFVTVRGTYPPHFMSLMRDSVSTLIHDRWPGLRNRYHMSVPCPTVEDAPNGVSKYCRGRFELVALQRFKADGEVSEKCPACFAKHDIDRLLTGFAGFSGDWRDEFDSAQKFASDSTGTGRLDLAVRKVLNAIGSKPECPRLFTLTTDDMSWVSKLKPSNWSDVWAKQRWRLTLWCEMPTEQHPTCAIGDTGVSGNAECGEYIVKKPRDWLVKIMPLVYLAARTLTIAGPIAKAGTTFASKDAVEQALAVVEASVTLSKLILDGEEESEKRMSELESDLQTAKADGAALRDFERLLKVLDSGRKWGGLSRVLDKSSGDWLWLCETHRKQIEPDLPFLPSA
jgi:hypothetical protein